MLIFIFCVFSSYFINFIIEQLLADFAFQFFIFLFSHMCVKKMSRRWKWMKLRFDFILVLLFLHSQHHLVHIRVSHKWMPYCLWTTKKNGNEILQTSMCIFFLPFVPPSITFDDGQWIVMAFKIWEINDPWFWKFLFFFIHSSLSFHFAILTPLLVSFDLFIYKFIIIIFMVVFTMKIRCREKKTE